MRWPMALAVLGAVVAVSAGAVHWCGGQTTVVLVARADKGAIAEAARTSEELRALGLGNQRLAINGVFHASDRGDAVARAIEDLGQAALAEMPASLRELPQDRVPLRPFDTVGLPALRALLTAGDIASPPPVAHGPGPDHGPRGDPCRSAPDHGGLDRDRGRRPGRDREPL